MARNISTLYINSTVENVWNVLTKPELVKQWQYGSDLVTDWKVGSEIRFRNQWEDKIFEQWGRIIEVNPHTLIKYSLFFPRPDLEDKPENYVIVTYELEEKENATRLTIRQENIPDEKTKAHSAENWKKVMTGLKKLVEEQEKQKMTSY